jgi:hypothetical protein
MLKSKQYGWTLDEHAKGYCCVFVYMRKDTTATQPCAEEEVRIHLDNPNAAIAFQKLLVEAGYKYKQVDIVTRPEWANKSFFKAVQ